MGLEALRFLHLERAIQFHGHEPLDTDRLGLGLGLGFRLALTLTPTPTLTPTLAPTLSSTPSLEGEAWLMHHNFMQAEGVANLHQLPPAGCLLSTGFAKLLGGSGGYARYVAICPGDWPHGVSIADAPGAPLPVQAAPLRRGADGVLRPTVGAAPTQYCEGSASLGCPPAP